MKDTSNKSGRLLLARNFPWPTTNPDKTEIMLCHDEDSPMAGRSTILTYEKLTFARNSRIFVTIKITDLKKQDTGEWIITGTSDHEIEVSYITSEDNSIEFAGMKIAAMAIRGDSRQLTLAFIGDKGIKIRRLETMDTYDARAWRKIRHAMLNKEADV